MRNYCDKGDPSGKIVIFIFTCYLVIKHFLREKDSFIAQRVDLLDRDLSVSTCFLEPKFLKGETTTKVKDKDRHDPPVPYLRLSV